MMPLLSTAMEMLDCGCMVVVCLRVRQWEGAATVTSCLMLESRSLCDELFMILKIYSNDYHLHNQAHRVQLTIWQIKLPTKASLRVKVGIKLNKSKLQYICESSMLTQQITPPPTSNEQIYSQLPSQIQPQPQSFPPPNALQYTESVQLRPLTTQVQQSSQSVQNLTSGQFGITPSMNHSAFASVRGSKYNNKYSFKRHGAADRSKLMSTSLRQVQASGTIGGQESLVNELNYWRSVAQQQENALVKIREFAFNRRRGIVDSSGLGLESIRHANSLSEIYNLSLLDAKLPPLEFLAENQQVVQAGQTVIQNGQQVVVNGSASVARQQEVVVNYELANQRVNSQVANNGISVSNNRPVVYIQQANQSARAPVSGQNVQQFKFQESSTFVPAPVPMTVPVQVPIQVPVNVSSTTTTVTAQRTNIPTQYTQVTQVSQSPRPQSISINPEAPSKPQKNDFSIPTYTPYEQSYKSYEVPTYKSNETSYKPYEIPSYSSNQQPAYTPKPQSFYFTRETEQYSLPNQNALNINTNSQLFTLEIRELRNKVETLQQQKSALIDKIRLIEKTNFNSNSQETIQVYRDEINQLKIQIAELTDLYNSGSGRQHDQTELTELRKSILILSETNKQYEEQLIQAQNHIIYLQNSRNADENTLHLQEEVKYLRETIAKYTEHVQQLDLQRQKYHELLQQRENEVQHYLQEVNESRAYIQTLEAHIEKTKHAVQGNGVSYDTYNQLIAEYGKKQLQTIILMEEINRLNYRYNELQAHLEKAEEYIIHIQETSGAGGNGNELGLLREQYEAELARAAEEKNTLNLTIQKLQNSIEQSGNIERTTKVSNSLPSNVENEQSVLREELARKEEEARLLSQQLSALTSKYAEIKDHLEKAEDYIIHLQEMQQTGSPVNTLVAPDTDRQKLEEELNSLQVKLGQYESQLLQERRERETLQNRSQLFSAEYEDMELRYKNALESLNKRYDQLLQERNSITARLSETEDRLLAEASLANREEISHLNSSMQGLDAQLKETREHLRRAQEYIEGNMRIWEEANGYKERHDQQLAFIQQLHQDLDSTKKQNQELAGKLEHFDNLVGEIERLRSENEKLTIVVHSKDNAGNATSLKQIDQTQESLENYTRLYQQSQTRVSTLRAELESLNHQLLAKQSQLDQTVHRSLQTEEHLRRAEEHILYMQQQFASAQTAIQQLQTALRAETAKSGELVEALKHAEDHIFHIEQQINRK